MPFWSFLPFDGGFMNFLSVVVFIATVVVHVACFNGIGAWLREHPDRALLLDGGIWKLCGLIFGLFGLLAFWAIHLSALRGSTAPSAPSPSPPPSA